MNLKKKMKKSKQNWKLKALKLLLNNFIIEDVLKRQTAVPTMKVVDAAVFCFKEIYGFF